MPFLWMLSPFPGEPAHCLEGIVRRCTETLATKTFDAIAFQGTSGALIAGMLSITLKKPLILVRKPSDFEPHEGMRPNNLRPLMVEGFLAAKTYVIIDDFSATGLTVRRIIKEIKGASDAKLVGLCFYSTNPCAFYKPGNKDFERITKGKRNVKAT